MKNPWLTLKGGEKAPAPHDPRVASWTSLQHLWAHMLEGVDEWRNAPDEKKRVYRGRIRGMAKVISMYESFYGVPQGRGRKVAVLEKSAAQGSYLEFMAGHVE